MRFLSAVSLVLVSLALILGSASCATSETLNVSACCMGDSITYGFGCTPYGRYETTLQTLLNTLPNENWTIYNVGISGDSTAQMLARFNADVLSHSDCEYVFIWGGINDVLVGYDVSIPKANLQSMFTQAHDAGIKVVSLNVTPLNYYLWTPAKRAAIKSINAWIAMTATDIDYKIDIYSVLEDPDNPDYLDPAYTDDGLHLNCDGYDLTADVVFHDVTWP
jgi:lysophospholipase L1-like esterase